jgi:hypothetical protein
VSPAPEEGDGDGDREFSASRLLEADAFMAFVVFNYAESMARYCFHSHWVLITLDASKTTRLTAHTR